MGLLSSIWEKISGVGERIEEAAERAWSEIKEHIPRPQPPPPPPSAPPPSQPPPSAPSPSRPVERREESRMLTSPIRRTAEKVAKKIESWLEKPIAWLEERSKIRGEPLSGYGAKFAKGMLLSVPQTVRFVGVVPYGVEKVIRKPSLLKKTPEFAVEFAKTTWHEARTRPFEFAGEFVGSTLLLGAAGRVAGRAMPVKPRISVAEFPEARIVSLGLEVRKLYGEAEFKPLVSFGRRGVVKPSLGKPKLVGEILSERPYVPQTPFERLVSLEYLRMKSPLEVGKVEWGVRAQQIVKGVKVKPRELAPVVRDVVVKRHKLPEEAADVLLKELRRHRARVYGSVAQEAAGREIGVRALSHIPRDIDVQVRAPMEFARELVEEVNKRLGRRVLELKGSNVVVRRTGEKLLDIHPLRAVGTSEGVVPLREGGYLAYGFKSRRLVKTSEGIRTTPLSEQALRKLAGAVELRAKPVEFGAVRGYVAPTHAGRLKDIADYFFAGKAAAERLRMLGKLGKAEELEFRLSRWLESWGEEVAENVRRMWKEARRRGGVRIELGSFEESALGELLRKSSPAVTKESPFLSASVLASRAVSPYSPILKSELSSLSAAARSTLTSFSTAVRGVSGASAATRRRMRSGVPASPLVESSPVPSPAPTPSPTPIPSPAPSPEPSPTPSPAPAPSLVSSLAALPTTSPTPKPTPKAASFPSPLPKLVFTPLSHSKTPQPVLPKLERRVRRVREKKKERARSKLMWFEASKFTRITPIAAPEELVTGTLMQKRRR